MTNLDVLDKRLKEPSRLIVKNIIYEDSYIILQGSVEDISILADEEFKDILKVGDVIEYILCTTNLGYFLNQISN